MHNLTVAVWYLENANAYDKPVNAKTLETIGDTLVK